MDDLPVRLDKEGFHNMMKANLSGREDHDGNETGIFPGIFHHPWGGCGWSDQKVPVGYIKKPIEPFGAGAYMYWWRVRPGGLYKEPPCGI